MSAPKGYRRGVGKVKKNRIENKVEENWSALTGHGWLKAVNASSLVLIGRLL